MPALTRTQEAATEKQLGNSAFRAGKYTQANKHYLKAAELSPTDPTLPLNSAACYLKLFKLQEAEAAASLAFGLDPQSAKALYRRGMARKGLNNIEGARDDWTRAISMGAGDEVTSELSKLPSATDTGDRISIEAVLSGKGKLFDTWNKATQSRTTAEQLLKAETYEGFQKIRPVKPISVIPPSQNTTKSTAGTPVMPATPMKYHRQNINLPNSPPNLYSPSSVPVPVTLSAITSLQIPSPMMLPATSLSSSGAKSPIRDGNNKSLSDSVMGSLLLSPPKITRSLLPTTSENLRTWLRQPRDNSEFQDLIPHLSDVVGEDLDADLLVALCTAMKGLSDPASVIKGLRRYDFVSLFLSEQEKERIRVSVDNII